MNLSLIAAFDDNKGVGLNNKLPWHIPEDLKHFKEKTSGHNMIMGKKTFDSLPGILPGRKHIVLTRNNNLISQNDSVIFINDLNECFFLLDLLKNKNNIVIGGSEIWKLFHPYINKFYITHVFGKYNVDTFFPDFIDFETMNLINKRTTDICEYLEYVKE